MSNTDKALEVELQKESVGWLSMIVILLGFPALFFLCVFLPMWLGWTNTF